MAGRGFTPKDPSVRARKNKDPIENTVVVFKRGEQPELPGSKWPERTRAWWETWGKTPQAEHFVATDWEFLLETALIHAKFWAGDMSMAGELRIRVAKFGATMEDRARLRITFAQAETFPDVSKPLSGSRKTRLLKAVGGIDGSESKAV